MIFGLQICSGFRWIIEKNFELQKKLYNVQISRKLNTHTDGEIKDFKLSNDISQNISQFFAPRTISIISHRKFEKQVRKFSNWLRISSMPNYDRYFLHENIRKVNVR